jgi:RNA-directed DNA polymerase
MIAEVKAFTTGWVTYFRYIQIPAVFRDLDGWIRRKLRCVRLKQCKRAVTIAAFLQGNGVPASRAWCLAGSGKGWWRLAGSQPAHEAMRKVWFDKLGLFSLTDQYTALNTVGNRRLR